MTEQQLVIHVVLSEMFGQNAYLAHLRSSQECVLIDPGFDADEIIERVEREKLTPVAILNTHGHADHIAGNGLVKDRWPQCPLVIGCNEATKLVDPDLNLSRPFGLDVTSPPADQLVRDGETLRVGSLEFDVLECPGHSRGHVVYLWKGGQPWVAFVGDVIFQGSVGRTDFPDGNTAELMESIRNRLYTLPPSTRLLPGHGPETTVAVERQHNPFVRS